MNAKTFAARAALAATAGLAALAVAGFAGLGKPRPDQERTYDPADSRAKLERIHRALTLYRQEYGVKPVAEWRTMADAGLPPMPMVLAFEQGKPWSLPIDAFIVSGSDHRWSNREHGPPFTSPWLDASVQGPKKLQAAERHLHRGEELVYLLDEHYLPYAEHKAKLAKAEPVPHLALRLDGRVEVVLIDPKDPESCFKQ